MTPTPLDIAIIGAGTAGLSAREEVAEVTENYRVFDPGPYGTTCARNACMPSKALLQSAHDFHRRHVFGDLGILGGEALTVDTARVLAETRRLRDMMVEGVVDSMGAWRDTHLVAHRARFQGNGDLQAGDTCYRPRATIIATGSTPVIPNGWRDRFGDRLLTSDDIFELDDLPRRVAVVGLGAVGLELGQALARLGVTVTGFDPTPSIGGLDHPELQAQLRENLSHEMDLVIDKAEPVETQDQNIRMCWNEGETEVDALLVAMGRAPNLGDLGLTSLGITLDDDGRPAMDDDRLDLPGSQIYFAGDVARGPAILHEASDEGRIAGYFAVRGEEAVFRRRAPLQLVFCDPQIALTGESWDSLQHRKAEIAVGEASFDTSGRTRLQRGTGGGLRIYADKATARILGAAILSPAAEHLAHLLDHAIDRGDDLKTLLRMPAYHPTHEEVLRRALRAALRDCDVEATTLEELRCQDPPVDCEAGRD